MKQSRIDSFMEALCNVAVGFGINFTANMIILPRVLGITLNASTNLFIGLLYTFISIARSYVIRRAFNGQTIWEAITGRISERG